MPESSASKILYCEQWSHIFVGKSDATTRWVLVLPDGEGIASSRFASAQIYSGNAWCELNDLAKADLLESVRDNLDLSDSLDQFILEHGIKEIGWSQLEFYQRTMQVLEVAATALKDISNGWPHNEIAGVSGAGLNGLVADLSAFLRDQGTLGDLEATAEKPLPTQF
ncbi:hypothetical protein KBW71_01290 [Hydrogenophaga aromaticivorans]|uniref:hypothetical protein n=1 Tax=Hydrogenophaga aromaticivorans TaxID=2610898 RepID=UPI001B391CA2|nr:hypothetical protein [Hydrogenophaga aromaticivorans]MBQ0917065.1 hypothetical protein [Hydrogenophaga aromaticivorans]